jgi:hypothetical protein
MDIFNSEWILNETGNLEYDDSTNKFIEIEENLKKVMSEMFFTSNRQKVAKFKDVDDLRLHIESWIKRSTIIQDYCDITKDSKFYLDIFINVLEGNGTLDYDDQSGFMFKVRKGEDFNHFVNEVLDSLI